MPAYQNLAPRYLISVEGTKLRADVTQFVSSVEYEETEDLASKITLSVANPDFRFNNSKVFAEGNKVDLWMGYTGRDLTYMNRGIIVRPNVSFPREGMPMLTVVAHGFEALMMRDETKGREFKRLYDAGIVSKLFEDVGIVGDPASGGNVFLTDGIKTRWMKKGTSKWQYLQKLAQLNGYVAYVDYDIQKGAAIGSFGPPSAVRGQEEFYTFSYGQGEQDSSLLDFEADMSLVESPTTLEVVYTDPKGRRTHKATLEVSSSPLNRAEVAFITRGVRGGKKRVKFSGTSGNDLIRDSIENGPRVKISVFGQSEEIIPNIRFGGPRDARRFAAAWWAMRERDFLFARGTTLGTPFLRRFQTHKFRLPGSRFDGDWRLSSVRHRMAGDSIYETEFTASKLVLASEVGEGVSDRQVKQTDVEQ